jgi:hypothetical protein
MDRREVTGRVRRGAVEHRLQHDESESAWRGVARPSAGDHLAGSLGGHAGPCFPWNHDVERQPGGEWNAMSILVRRETTLEDDAGSRDCDTEVHRETPRPDLRRGDSAPVCLSTQVSRRTSPSIGSPSAAVRVHALARNAVPMTAGCCALLAPLVRCTRPALPWGERTKVFARGPELRPSAHLRSRGVIAEECTKRVIHVHRRRRAQCAEHCGKLVFDGRTECDHSHGRPLYHTSSGMQQPLSSE